MTKWWRKYWKEKNHIRKGICDNLLGIDSFHIFKKEKYLIDNRKDYFAFNNYTQNYERIIKVNFDGDKFCFNIVEYGRELNAELLEDGFHVSVIEFFSNHDLGHPTITSRLSYTIPIEKQQCNGCTFFRCPDKDCNRRMRRLYYSYGHFFCRKCLNLGYRSQRISPFERKRMNKLKVRIFGFI